MRTYKFTVADGEVQVEVGLREATTTAKDLDLIAQFCKNESLAIDELYGQMDVSLYEDDWGAVGYDNL